MPTIVINNLSESRKRFDAHKKGLPVPPRQTPIRPLTDEEAEPFITKLAEVLAKAYRKDLERGEMYDKIQ